MMRVKTLKVRVGLCFSRNSRVITYKSAQEFSLTFDGCRAKVGDIQLEITEEFLSEATSLPLTGQKWFKNSKLERYHGVCSSPLGKFNAVTKVCHSLY
jgi:hypothetical protein